MSIRKVSAEERRYRQKRGIGRREVSAEERYRQKRGIDRREVSAEERYQPRSQGINPDHKVSIQITSLQLVWSEAKILFMHCRSCGQLKGQLNLQEISEVQHPKLTVKTTTDLHIYKLIITPQHSLMPRPHLAHGEGSGVTSPNPWASGSTEPL